MKQYKIALILTTLIGAFIVAAPAALQPHPTAYTQQQIAQLLHWIPSDHGCHLCGGYYQQPPIIRDHPHPAKVRQTPLYIRSKGPTIYLNDGRSIIQDSVYIRQPGRTLRADKATIYRNNTTGKISHIQLIGHVQLREPGRLITGSRGRMDFSTHAIKIYHSVYHSFQQWVLNSGLNAWGTARSAIRDANKVIHLSHATYTTCSPVNPSWHISATDLTLNKKTETGVARNAVLWIKKIPIFYFPYYSFPLIHQRKSGFLAPYYLSNKRSGLSLNLPFYWNISPNYDATITPRFITRRGVMASALLRYLTRHNAGLFYVSYLPEDHGFNKFRNTQLATYAGNTSATLTPYINQLRNISNNRGFLALKDTTVFNRYWHSHINLNYVTDPYFFKDFGATYAALNQNQLLNQIDLAYEGLHWDVTTLAQNYQTLHQINDVSANTVSQYTRLPEVDVSGSYPNIHHFDLELSAQVVNFLYHSSFVPFTFMQPLGERLHLRPSVSRPFNWTGGYTTPQLAIDNTSYSTRIPNSIFTDMGRRNFNASRNLPIFDLDNGLYFNRDFHFHGHRYIQTLSPRLMYLYIPYVKQNQFPVFDTQLLPFSYQQIFALNRFAGFDRLDNANQINLGLTSQILTGNNSDQVLTAGVGVIDYLDQPRVQLPGLNIQHRHLSPVAGQLTYYPFQHWSIAANAAWDAAVKQMNNYSYTLSYQRDGQHIITAGYQFVHGPVNQPRDQYGFTTNTSILKLGFTWPLIRRWSTIAYWNYDLSKHRQLNTYGGLEYSTCCWALRAVVEHSFIGQQPFRNSTTRFTNRFQTTYFLQFILKGLGGAGNGDAGSLLRNTLGGYHDLFDP